MSTLFHYTSNEGAFGIIGTRCLFATNYKYLNDSNELKVAYDIILPIFEENFRDAYRSMVKSKELNKGLEQEHGINVYNVEAARLLNYGLEATDNISPIFISSFCTHIPESYEWHNGLLSQWRGYGSRGGCSFEFEDNLIDDMIKNENNTYAYNKMSRSNVIYKDHSPIFSHLNLKEIPYQLLRGMVAVANGGVAEPLQSDALYEALALIAPTLKQEAFIEESETRIIAPCVRKTGMEEHPERLRKPVLTRFRNGMPISYIRLFEDDAGFKIKRIIIGPQKDQEKVQFALELALEGAGLDTEVVLSKTSYLP